MPKKPKPKNKRPSQVWLKYSSGKKLTCPKCGPGIFLANHSDRLYCGKCKYVEMKSK